MSVIKTYNSELLGEVRYEIYNSANQVVDDLKNRKKTSNNFKGDEYSDTHWVGANREQAYEMLRHGYQPTVEKFRKIKSSLNGTGSSVRFTNNVYGFAPIVPNAILGLPNSMIDCKLKPIKGKVIDVYYDMTCNCGTRSDDIIRVGNDVLSNILDLESSGYRVNLFCIQTYYGTAFGETKASTDMLCVKIKSADQPLDIKRISFPIAHTAFFRGIGFEWYSKFPLGKYRSGYGRAVGYSFNKNQLSKEFKAIFHNEKSVYINCSNLLNVDSREVKENIHKYIIESCKINKQ